LNPLQPPDEAALAGATLPAAAKTNAASTNESKRIKGILPEPGGLPGTPDDSF
jgi:hypothetical protein